MCIMTLHHDMSDGDTAAVDTRKGGGEMHLTTTRELHILALMLMRRICLGQECKMSISLCPPLAGIFSRLFMPHTFVRM